MSAYSVMAHHLINFDTNKSDYKRYVDVSVDVTQCTYIRVSNGSAETLVQILSSGHIVKGAFGLNDPPKGEDMIMHMVHTGMEWFIKLQTRTWHQEFHFSQPTAVTQHNDTYHILQLR